MERIDVIAKIKDSMSGLSKGHKSIAAYILENRDKAAFMTAAALGSAVDVSESTVVRFAAEMGYEGYPQMQKALQASIRGRLTNVQRMELATSKMGEENILKSVIHADIEKLRQTAETLDNDDFLRAVEAIAKAKKIYVLGARSCSSLTSFLGFYLNLIFKDVKTISTSSDSETFEQIFRVGEGDAVIAISFPRYSSRTVKAVSYASSNGADVVAITDSMDSPIIPYATHSLIARSDMSYFADSLVAPLSIINAIIMALAIKNEKAVRDTFDKLENIWDKYEVYEKHE
ncbi:MAG: MurR/RpiR family transcriptional regulator [Ruminococcaceae bacterium]|nr:MurR/RpiR family transcriptional regulator [Oscillospiraceae bacterium]